MKITTCIATVNGVAEATLLTMLLVPPVSAESAGANQARLEIIASLEAVGPAAVGLALEDMVWQPATAQRLGLESTLRPPGRPRGDMKKS